MIRDANLRQAESPKEAKGLATMQDNTFEGPFSEVLSRALFEPVRELLERPSKNVRAHLVWTGFALASESDDINPIDLRTEKACARLAEALEAIHAGSLIIDDIQDDSLERRGSLPIHRIYGMPLSLNAGNWLYFQPLTWIRELELEPQVELKLYHLFHDTMAKAHLGQAIDLGTRIDECIPSDVEDLCLNSLRLKTGALTGLALAAGAALAKPSARRLDAIYEFGIQFGMALQMFDDIGNFVLPTGHPKRLEDFRLRRPTWLWALVSKYVTETEYDFFRSCVQLLPVEGPLLAWVERNQLLPYARRKAHTQLEKAMALLEEELGTGRTHESSLKRVRELAERIANAYG